MTKQETIKRIDEELIQLSNDMMDNDSMIDEKRIEYTNMLARVKNALLNQEIQNVNVCNVVTVDKFTSIIREECRMPNAMTGIVNKMSDF